MQYSELEDTVDKYNKLVNVINSIIDTELAQNGIQNAPYKEFELLQAKDDNENHLPYLYFRFVHLPYKDGRNK